MSISRIALASTALLSATPLIAFAAIRTLQDFICLLISLVWDVIPLVEALALLVFFWGLFTFIRENDNETKRSEGKTLMLWGIIALFIMVSVGPILNILSNTFFGGGSSTISTCGPSSSNSAAQNLYEQLINSGSGQAF